VVNEEIGLIYALKEERSGVVGVKLRCRRGRQGETRTDLPVYILSMSGELPSTMPRSHARADAPRVELSAVLGSSSYHLTRTGLTERTISNIPLPRSLHNVLPERDRLEAISTPRYSDPVVEGRRSF
jgi:hypothetical protein